MSQTYNDGVTQITATGGETTVNWDFKIANRDELRIIRTRSGVNEVLVLDSQYTIADDQLNVELGGTAVLAGTATPAVAGDIYTLLLYTPYSRADTSDFQQRGDFFSSTLNAQLDVLVRMCQRLGRDVMKSIRLPDTDLSTLEGTLPDAATRAGKAMFFDASGNPSVTATVDTISAAAAAASASAAAVSAANAAASAAGFKLKAPVRMATTANITLSGIQTIDGVVGVSGDRVLVKNQTTTSQNGIYVMAAGSWTRATDCDTWTELVAALVAVNEGSTNADILFLCTVNDGGTLGTTSVTFNSWYSVVPDNTVTNAKMADMAGNTVKVRAASTTGDPSDLALSTGQFPGRGSSGDIVAMSFGSGFTVGASSVSCGPTLLTPQATTSGTTKDFIVPSGAKIVFVMFKNVSTGGTSHYLVQLGDAGGIETSGYNGIMVASSTGGGVSGAISSSGFPIYNALAAAATFGCLTLSLENSSTFSWTANGTFYNYDGGTGRVIPVSGEKSLSQELTTVRVTTISADTFDAGEINVMCM